MKTPIQYLRFLVLVLLPTIGFHSCTKTEYLEYEKEALTRILEYKVTNTQQELYGAIDNNKNTITIIVPYYLSVEYLVSEIKLEEGATLYDTLGNEINLDGGLDPIRLGENVKYTVKSATGAERTYTLTQKILPHQDDLEVKYKDVIADGSILAKPVHAKLILLGNFESVSTNARFIFTDRATGKVYDNFARAYSVTPGDEYNMEVDILAAAMAGEYDLRIEHQGRTATLPPIKLEYRRPSTTMFLSSARFAPGDEITFTARSGSTFGYPRGDADAGVFVGVKRIYLKMDKATGTAPVAFPDNLSNTPIAMEIISQSRTEIKAIFPDIPAGLYTTNYPWYNDNPAVPTYYGAKGFGFYADYDEQTDWGDGVIFSMGYSFTVTPKP